MGFFSPGLPVRMQNVYKVLDVAGQTVGAISGHAVSAKPFVSMPYWSVMLGMMLPQALSYGWLAKCQLVHKP
jgi:hypothetical protein